MALECLNDTLTHEEYLQKRTNKSYDTGNVVKCALSNMKIFLKESYDKELYIVIEELKEDFRNTGSIAKSLSLLQNYVNFITDDHPGLETPANALGNMRPWVPKSEASTRNYLAQLRIYLMHVGGVYIPADLLTQRIDIPYDTEESAEAEPLLPEEFRLILDNQGSLRRQVMYRVMKDTCSRIRAMCGLKKENFDTTAYYESNGKMPIMVTFPAKIMKKKSGKSSTVTKFISKETELALLSLLKKYKDDDLVFVDNPNLRLAAKNEGLRWKYLVKSLGFTETYEKNGRLKKNIHSIKAFTETAAEEAVDEAYANAYGDHKRYLPQYIRWSLEKKIAKFRAMEPLIALYTTVQNVCNDEQLEKENRTLNETLATHDVILKELAEKTKGQSSQIPDAKLKRLFEEILRENNIIP